MRLDVTIRAARQFDCLGARALIHEALKVRIDHPILRRHDGVAGLVLPRGHGRV
jgi:hypothetical protein